MICIYSNAPVEFVTLSSDSIKINTENKKRIGREYSALPALKIGRLAIHKDYKRKNRGTLIIMSCR